MPAKFLNGLTTAPVVDSAYGGTGVNNAGRTLTISSNGGTLAFSGASLTLTIPATGTAALGGGNGSNTRVAFWTDANTLSSDLGMTYATASGNLTITGIAQCLQMYAVRNDGNYCFKLERTSAPAHAYGFAISGSDGNFLLDDITSAARRWTMTTGGAMWVGIGVGGLTGAGDLDIGGNARIAGNIGFYNTSPQSKPTVSGSRGGNAALASLCTALATVGLITNSTS